jgi:hypothetical protein
MTVSIDGSLSVSGLLVYIGVIAVGNPLYKTTGLPV